MQQPVADPVGVDHRTVERVRAPGGGGDELEVRPGTGELTGQCRQVWSRFASCRVAQQRGRVVRTAVPQ